MRIGARRPRPLGCRASRRRSGARTRFGSAIGIHRSTTLTFLRKTLPIDGFADAANAGVGKVDPATALRMLNDGLATEIACMLRCKRHHYSYMLLATSAQAPSLATQCLEHAAEEQSHAQLLTERIVQLGGVPELDCQQYIEQDCSHLDEHKTHVEMIQEDLVAERNAIDGYTEMIRYFGDHDPTTRRMLERILVVEMGHADELNGLLRDQFE